MSLCLAALCAPASALAQEFPGIPLGPVVPAPSWAPPPVEAPPPPGPQRWYGWQILLPTLASDAMILGGVLGSSEKAGTGVLVAGLIGHGISGPIVHLAHGKPLKALASFGLEAALPGAMIAIGALSPCNDDFCGANLAALAIGVPIALTAGAVIDSSALAWEERSRPSATSISLAPLVLPPPHIGAGSTPRPAGVSLVGTF